MKKYFILSLLIATLYSCNKDKPLEVENDVAQTTQLTGTISLSDSTPAYKIQVFAYDYLAADYEEFTTDVDASGNFTLEIPIKQAMEITAIASTPFSFLAAPGDSIHVAISSVAVDSLSDQVTYKFTGDRAAANQKLQDYNTGFPVDIQQFYDSESETAMVEFLAFAKANQSTINNYNNKFLDKVDDQLLKDYVRAQEKYYFPTTKIDFANYRKYYGFEAPEADSDYYDFIKELPEFEKSDLVNTGTVQRLIYNLTFHYRSKARSLAADNLEDDAIDIKAIELAASENSDALLYDYVIHDLYYKTLSDHDITVYDATQNQLEKYISNVTIRKSIVDKYNNEKELLESPELPEEAELLSFNSSNPEDYLDEITKNANGKVVYIDNWATWCGPCKVEFKNASPKLHEKFKEDVEFVYFCHSSERRAYIPSIAEFNIKGKHYFLTDEESAVISKMIDLEGFPTYTVINKSGEIVLSDYIHRPSYPATTELLTKLTNE